MFNLAPYSSNIDRIEPPRGTLSSNRERFTVKFEVPFKEEVYASKNFKHAYQNWGLWDYDVVEVFLTRDPKAEPYLELQVSPFNQNFALIVEEPRKKTHYPKLKPFKSTVQLLEEKWIAEIVVPWDNIPGKDSLVRGNLHAILGKNRNHFSLKPSKGKPDFHRPDLFVFLGDDI